MKIMLIYSRPKKNYFLFASGKIPTYCNSEVENIYVM